MRGNSVEMAHMITAEEHRNLTGQQVVSQSKSDFQNVNDLLSFGEDSCSRGGFTFADIKNDVTKNDVTKEPLHFGDTELAKLDKVSNIDSASTLLQREELQDHLQSMFDDFELTLTNAFCNDKKKEPQKNYKRDYYQQHNGLKSSPKTRSKSEEVSSVNFDPAIRNMQRFISMPEQSGGDESRKSVTTERESPPKDLSPEILRNPNQTGLRKSWRRKCTMSPQRGGRTYSNASYSNASPKIPSDKDNTQTSKLPLESSAGNHVVTSFNTFTERIEKRLSESQTSSSNTPRTPKVFTLPPPCGNKNKSLSGPRDDQTVEPKIFPPLKQMPPLLGLYKDKQRNHLSQRAWWDIEIENLETALRAKPETKMCILDTSADSIHTSVTNNGTLDVPFELEYRLLEPDDEKYKYILLKDTQPYKSAADCLLGVARMTVNTHRKSAAPVNVVYLSLSVFRHELVAKYSSGMYEMRFGVKLLKEYISAKKAKKTVPLFGNSYVS